MVAWLDWFRLCVCVYITMTPYPNKKCNLRVSNKSNLKNLEPTDASIRNSKAHSLEPRQKVTKSLKSMNDKDKIFK